MGNDEKTYRYTNPKTGETRNINLLEHGNIRVNDLENLGVIENNEASYQPVQKLPFGGPLADFYRNCSWIYDK